ncbi:hypothetical protein A4A49_49667 [Nicotiana attenuata]|uniref:Uncharacterized protein n=1 Tax=Nicotiana attenuata TaxID=49451 RepID=A0A314KKT8_NICAT|nr:hypothetical protein A4A49_49667 [Nicotiana attenuata]
MIVIYYFYQTANAAYCSLSVMCLSFSLLVRLGLSPKILELHATIDKSECECRGTSHQSKGAGTRVRSGRGAIVDLQSRASSRSLFKP